MYDIYKNGPYTIQQRVQIVELFYENRRSHFMKIKNVFRKLRDICNRLSESAINRIVQKFQEIGLVKDKRREKYCRTGRSQEHIWLMLPR